MRVAVKGLSRLGSAEVLDSNCERVSTKLPGRIERGGAALAAPPRLRALESDRVDQVPIPGPTNSAQLRLNRLPPVCPPVTARNTRNNSCVPASEIGNV